MKLILTHYIDRDPASTGDRLAAAISRALDSATERVAGRRDETVTEAIVDGVRVRHGLGMLEGVELLVAGSADLTELRVEVPWADTDSGTSKLWAANRFAGVLADELAAA
jgi:hypothetical protein